MDRHPFLGGLALGVLALPHVVRAQPTPKVRRVGILTLGFVSSDMIGPQPRSAPVSALLSGLRDLGYVYGRDFMTEPRGAEQRPERVAALAAELISLQVDVIVAGGVTLGVLKQTTSTIPVVMAASDDPVARGHVRSLGHPGGNFTGLATQGIETVGKRLELLKEIVPAAAPIAVLWDQASRPVWQASEAAAMKRGWKLLSLEIRDKSEIEGAFAAATKARAGAIVVSAIRFTGNQAQRVAELAAKSRLPALYDLRFFVDAGGLISYGVDIDEIWRRAAVFVDKILRGTKPADLPVEQVAKFDLAITLKTAKAPSGNNICNSAVGGVG